MHNSVQKIKPRSFGATDGLDEIRSIASSKLGYEARTPSISNGKHNSISTVLMANLNELKKSLKRVDKEGKGIISSRELQKVLKALNVTIDEQVLARFYTEELTSLHTASRAVDYIKFVKFYV